VQRRRNSEGWGGKRPASIASRARIRPSARPWPRQHLARGICNDGHERSLASQGHVRGFRHRPSAGRDGLPVGARRMAEYTGNCSERSILGAFAALVVEDPQEPPASRSIPVAFPRTSLVVDSPPTTNGYTLLRSYSSNSARSPSLGRGLDGQHRSQMPTNRCGPQETGEARARARPPARLPAAPQPRHGSAVGPRAASRARPGGPVQGTRREERFTTSCTSRPRSRAVRVPSPAVSSSRPRSRAAKYLNGHARYVSIASRCSVPWP